MAPASRKDTHTAAPATSPAAPSRAKIPAPTMAPTPMKAAWRTDRLLGASPVTVMGASSRFSCPDLEASTGGCTPPRFGWLPGASRGLAWSRPHGRRQIARWCTVSNQREDTAATESPANTRLAVLLAMAMFVLVVDTSLMNVSISAVVRDLDTTVSGVQSAIALEALVSAAF